jgi:hypothetical protein
MIRNYGRFWKILRRPLCSRCSGDHAYKRPNDAGEIGLGNQPFSLGAVENLAHWPKTDKDTFAERRVGRRRVMRSSDKLSV